MQAMDNEYDFNEQKRKSWGNELYSLVLLHLQVLLE